jgi:NAD(P)-dependent dehydrogenase (short-subunit alcohol dehydrogenase family)
VTQPTLLEARVVVVTGAGGGSGAGIARLDARHGGRVVVNDLGGSPQGEGQDRRVAQFVADEIKASGGQAVPSFHSVASWEGASAIIDDALAAFGRIDAVVNNAGVLRDGIFHRLEPEDWDIVENVNLSGCFYVARAAAPHFKRQEAGCFIHMTSTSGLIGNVGQVNYGATKLGVAGLSKCIALDMAKFKVRSNCIAPFAFTRMVDTIPADTDFNRARLEVAKRMTPDKIAPFAVALMSDRAADVTGQIFGVRNNEIVLFSQPRPVRSVQSSEGWTPERCLDVALPALRPTFHRLDRSPDIFSWDPI